MKFIHCVVAAFLVFSAISFNMLSGAAVADEGESLPRVTIGGDRFMADGQPIYFWGFNQSRGFHLTDEQYRANAERMGYLGVNLLRLHSISARHYPGPDDQGVGFLSYRREQGKKATDPFERVGQFYKLLDSLKQEQIYVVLSVHALMLSPDDVEIIETTEEDRQAWYEAIADSDMQQHQSMGLHKALPVIDERASQIKQLFIRRMLNLKHPQTGQRLATDPQIVMLETTNEGEILHWVRHRTLHKRWPQYFQNKLSEHWRWFLLRRHGTDEALRNAWNEQGKTGLRDDESIQTAGRIGIHPLVEEDEDYSVARRQDLIDFLFELDRNHQRQIEHLVRDQGFEGYTNYSDTFGHTDNTGAPLIDHELTYYVADHAYMGGHDVFRAQRVIAAHNKLRTTGHNPYDYGKPSWRSEARNADGGLRQIHWSRVANPLYYAVYSNLIGRDGVTFHSWTMSAGAPYDLAEVHEDAFTHNIIFDLPWQIAFRAAGRLYRSGQINKLPDHHPVLPRLGSHADVRTPQVHRSAADGLLRVETEDFVALATDQPGVFSFRDVRIELTSDRCNVLVLERLDEHTYELTAMGMAGDSSSEETDYRIHMKEPLAYVQGSLSFPGRSVARVKHLDAAGQVMQEHDVEGTNVDLAEGVWIYRIHLEP